MYKDGRLLYKRRLREGSRRKIIYRKFLSLYTGKAGLYKAGKSLYRFSLRETPGDARYTGLADFCISVAATRLPGRADIQDGRSSIYGCALERRL